MITDPAALATITAALTLLGVKAVEGTVTEAGKDLWKTVRKLLGWNSDPPADSLAPRIALRLRDDEALTIRLAELLRSHPEAGTPSLMVGSIQAGKVVVAETLNVSGDFSM